MNTIDDALSWIRDAEASVINVEAWGDGAECVFVDFLDALQADDWVSLAKGMRSLTDNETYLVVDCVLSLRWRRGSLDDDVIDALMAVVHVRGFDVRQRLLHVVGSGYARRRSLKFWRCFMSVLADAKPDDQLKLGFYAAIARGAEGP